MAFEWNETEFLSIATECGLVISTDDLEALQKRRLLEPWILDEKKKYGYGHLFVLANYFDAIRIVRHPWGTQNSQISLQDIKALNKSIRNLFSGPSTLDSEVLMKLTDQVDVFLNKINPWGTLKSLIELLSEDSKRSLRNSGRLHVVMLGFKKELHKGQAIVEPIVSENTRAKTEMLPIIDRGPHESEELPEISTENIQAIPTEDMQVKTEENPVVSKEAVIEEKKRLSEKSEPTKIEEPVKEKVIEEKVIEEKVIEEKVIEEKAEDKANEVVEPVTPKPLSVGGVGGVDGDKTLPVTTSFSASPDQSLEVVLTDFLDEDSFVDDEIESEDEIWAREKTENTEVPEDSEPVEEKPNPFRRTEKTQDLISRINELKIATQPNPTDLKEQIIALNQRRKELIEGKNWRGLAELYEEKIDLFPNLPERQEVLLTIGTLHELKLKDPKYAIAFFQAAIENGSENGLKKAYEGFQRTGLRPELRDHSSSWLEKRVSQEISDFERPIIQHSHSNFLREIGETHRAFLSYAAFLTGEPKKYVNEASLHNLEDFAADVDDSELEAFFGDLLDYDEDSSDFSTNRALIAKHAGLFYEKRNPMIAVKYLRTTLDANPADEDAFRVISHIYQEEQNWPDLVQLASNRYKVLSPTARVGASAQLTHFISEDIEDEGAEERYQDWVEREPNSWAVEGIIAIYEKNERFTEGYSSLQQLLPNVDDVEKKGKIYKSLAETALKHFDSPEDAISHYQKGIELGGEAVELLEGLVRVQIDTGNWSEALLVLDKLTSSSFSLPTENRRSWLNRGIQIAEQENDSTALALFGERLVNL